MLNSLADIEISKLYFDKLSIVKKFLMKEVKNMPLGKSIKELPPRDTFQLGAVVGQVSQKTVEARLAAMRKTTDIKTGVEAQIHDAASVWDADDLEQ